MSEKKMNTTEAAEFLGIHHSRVRQLVRAGLLPAEMEETPRGPVYWLRQADLARYQEASAQENEARRGKPGRPKKVRPDARPRAKVVNGRLIYPPKPLPELEGLPPAVQALIREVDRGLAVDMALKYPSVSLKEWETVFAEVRRRLVAAFEGKGLTTLPKKTATPKTDEGGQPS